MLFLAACSCCSFALPYLLACCLAAAASTRSLVLGAPRSSSFASVLCPLLSHSVTLTPSSQALMRARFAIRLLAVSSGWSFWAWALWGGLWPVACVPVRCACARGRRRRGPTPYAYAYAARERSRLRYTQTSQPASAACYCYGPRPRRASAAYSLRPTAYGLRPTPTPH